jgi:hypothetical protein
MSYFINNLKIIGFKNKYIKIINIKIIKKELLDKFAIYLFNSHYFHVS